MSPEQIQSPKSEVCRESHLGVRESAADAMSPKEREKALERRQLLLRAEPLFARRLSQTEVARELGVSIATVTRLLAFGGHAGGPHERVVKALAKPLHRLVDWGKRGPRSPFDQIAGNEHVRRRLHELYLATVGASSEAMTHGRRTGSAALALLRFADDALCPAGLAKRLQAGAQPAVLMRVIREVTPELEQHARGERHAQLHTIRGRRGMTVLELDGSESDLLAGDLWELDDMSVNQPFACPDGRGGWILSRQGLYCRDVRSRKWLGVELVARPRESYRAEDVLRFLRRLMTDYGKPRRGLRLERGIWASRRIRGYEVSADGFEEVEFERDPMADEERHRLQDGVRSLGIEIFWTHNAHGKAGIESSFRQLQAVAATLTTEWQNIGRHAGEFERAARELRRARSGVDPVKLGFAPMNLLADRTLEAMAWMDLRDRDEEGASAQMVWDRDTGVEPLEALCLTDLAAFLPEVRESTIRGGCVTCKVNGVPHDFRAPEVMAELGHGFRVHVRFDPCEPSLGAAIYSRESGSANHHGFAMGQFLGWAAYEPPGHQLDLTKEYAGAKGQQTQRAWHRSAYRALPRPGQPRVAINAARDGRGRVVIAAEGDAVATPEILSKPKDAERSTASQAPTGERSAQVRRGSGNAAADEDVTAILGECRRRREQVVDALPEEFLEELDHNSNNTPTAPARNRDYAVSLEELEAL